MTIQLHLTTRDGGERLAARPGPEWRPLTGWPPPQLLVDPDARFQEIHGFGGAITESAVVALSKVPADARRRVLEAYFDPRAGHGYSFCRTHINSCDFSLGNYACCDTPGDVELKTFSIERERGGIIPMIREASKLRGENIRVLASPWSPPAWMKTTGMMNRGGKLRPEFRAAWARYYVRFIREFEKEGIPIWGVTVQNEPQASQTWDSCLYDHAEERDFVRDHLGPALARDGGGVKLFIWDHNRDQVLERARTVFTDPVAARFVDGVAYHWYGGDFFENVAATHALYPDKMLLFSEGCLEGGVKGGAWESGEAYGHGILGDLNAGAAVWIDWNIALDEQGGPNHVGNFCDAPVIADGRSGEVTFQSSYWYIGHFSRFIPPGSRRIALARSTNDFEAGAFVTPDEKIVLVVMNRAGQAREFRVGQADREFTAIAAARSIQTFVWE